MSTMRDEQHNARAHNKLAIGYARVSTDRQGTIGVSLEAQRIAIETFAEEAGYVLLEVYEDVASGRGEKSFHARQGLQNALKHAVCDEAEIIVWRWDRLTRHAGFEKQIRDVLPDERQIVCVEDPSSLDAASRAARHKHSEHVANEISRRTKEEMAKKRAKGAVFGNPEIYSVQPLAVQVWSDRSETLIHKIADVLRHQSDPVSLTHKEVAKLLNDRGIRTGHSNDWTASRVRVPRAKAMKLLEQERAKYRMLTPLFGTF
ncbi:recombinase family protein [Salipiger bermudensis]|uniref:recombinase family protein n=1 Tax=Salipiger bermudensis TaxID=344736 RepID=UPI001C9988F6|nr:recombinase family protein [Salipiger bermudensis]MBY6003286.1 recombinase family protein [Salipiger bermudensis]